jgi:hypothetical protein
MKVVVGGRNGRMAFLRWALCLCATHLILEVLTLGLIGIGMACTNCWLLSLFLPE